MSNVTVGIVGASGYTGLALIQQLLTHPCVNITYLAANRYAGTSVSALYPQLEKSELPASFDSFDPSHVPHLDVLFLALPHGQSHSFLSQLMATNRVGTIIDLSADFRLKDADIFQQYYGMSHQLPSLLGDIPLGLPEVYRSSLKGASVAACPGCYATSVILGLYPLAKEKKLQTIIVDSKSGVSGAGRSLKDTSLYCEVNESVTAYQTAVHRHTAEITQELDVPVIFSPHLVPMMRGILSSCYVTLTQPTDVIALYQSYFQKEPFVMVSSQMAGASTKYVVGSNNVHISFKQVSDTQWVIFSALDNLLKGAAGQAIQVMNSIKGWDETMGLSTTGRYV